MVGALLDAAVLAQLQNPITAARLECDAVASISSSSTTQLGFNIVAFDTSGGAIADPTNDWLLINRTGIWIVEAYCRFASTSSTAERNLFVGLNGTGTRICSANSGLAGGQALNVSSIYRLGVGDVLQAFVWQSTGATLGTDPSFGHTALAATYLGAG
jgi:hypothetical protein